MGVVDLDKKNISRREFVKRIGSGSLSVGFAVVVPLANTRAAVVRDHHGAATQMLSWIVIHADNTATIRVPQTELGQGVATTIPQILADELELDWSQVDFEFYDPRTNAARGNVFVWTTAVSSSSAHYLYTPARTAAAQIRTLLVDAAAVKLGLPAEELVARASRIEHPSSLRTLSYAEVAADAAKREIPSPDQVALKVTSQQTLLGKPLARLDLAAMVDGSKVFGIDVQLPGMRYAAIRQSPVYRASLTHFDHNIITGMGGSPKAFRVERALVGYNSPVPEGEDPDLWAATVKIDDAVAVVADTWWQAKSALEALPIKWSESLHQTFSSEKLMRSLTKKVASPLPVIAETGDVDAALKAATQRLEALYTYPFMEPAPLEPMNCTALVNKDEVHVWTNSQYPDDAWRIAYELGGVAPEHAQVHLMPAGGGFGRRLHNDFVHQAVQIAKQNPGTPIKLLWTREESTKHSFYAPLTVARFDGGIDKEGNLNAWRCRVASGFSAEQSYGAARIPFRPKNARFEYQRDQETPVPFGWMRGVGFTQHLWMNFSFLDELRLAAGKESVGFYRDLLDPRRFTTDSETYQQDIERANRNLRLLEFASNNDAWRSPKRPGSGRGICVSDSDYYAGYSSSTKAAIVDVSLDERGLPIVERVYIAIDAGRIINPDVVRGQLEGGVAYALTTALMSEITVEDGQVQQSNFHDYPILGLAQMPPVEIEILPSDGPPLGVGEDAVPVTIAAVINAIVDAGGPRIRSLPIKPLA